MCDKIYGTGVGGIVKSSVRKLLLRLFFGISETLLLVVGALSPFLGGNLGLT